MHEREESVLAISLGPHTRYARVAMPEATVEKSDTYELL